MNNQETPQQKARRLAMNTWIQCLALSKKSQLLFRQKVKEIELKECKKAFGVAYLDLVEKEASDVDLQACIDSAKRQVAEISLAISELKVAIKRADNETQSKIEEEPSQTSNTVDVNNGKDEYIVVDGPSSFPSAPLGSEM